MEKVKAQKRNGELDFFKLLFCIVVISFHSGYFIQSENGYFKGGSIAVDFFLCCFRGYDGEECSQKSI